MNALQKITTFLTFDDQAEEAMNFYTSIFDNSRIVSTSRYGKAGPGAEGTLMSGTFELEGPPSESCSVIPIPRSRAA